MYHAIIITLFVILKAWQSYESTVLHKTAQKAFKLYEDDFVFFDDFFSPKHYIKSNVSFIQGDIATLRLNQKFDFIFVRKMLYYLPKGRRVKTLVCLLKLLKSNLSPYNHIIFCDTTHNLVPDLRYLIEQSILKI